MSTTSLPECVQPGAATIAAGVGCGQDISCGCNNEEFLAELQPMIYQLCTDPVGALTQAQNFCIAANPHLLDTRRNTLIIPISIFSAVAISVVVLRFYSRRVSKTKIGIDDWLAVGALVFAMASNILELYGLKNGEATHQFMVRLELMEASNKSTIATNWTTTFAILLLKLSILALYLRLFGSVWKFTLTVYGVGIFTTVVSILMALLVTLQCTPVAYFWNRAIPGGKCWNFQQLVVAVAAVDLVTGLMILPLPLPMLWGLQMNLGKKLAIAGLFVVGGFTCLAGALRIPFILLIDSYDIFWSLIPFTVFSCLEVNVGVISVCLPALRPVFSEFMARTGLSDHSGSSSKQHSRIPDQNMQIYTGGVKAHNTNGVWTSPKGSRATDSQRILGRKSDDEDYPMSSIDVTKEVDVNSKQNSLKDSSMV